MAKTIYGPCMNGNVDFEMNELILHGIGNGMVGFNAYAHVVFTAPADLTCSVTATFIGRQVDINVDVHVLLKGNPVFNSTITEDGVVREYLNPAVSLDAGDTVSFAVGPHQQFGLHPGNTALEAVLDCYPD